MKEREPSEQPKPLFALGNVVATPGFLAAIERTGEDFNAYLFKHVTGDWGVLEDEDKELNDRAVQGEDRIFSAYQLEDGTKVWVITEWNRSHTTMLLPNEY